MTTYFVSGGPKKQKMKNHLFLFMISLKIITKYKINEG